MGPAFDSPGPNRRFRGLVATVAIGLVGVSCAHTPNPASPPAPAKIGALYPTSGAQGSEGAEEFHGVELAAEWANSHGGMGGRPYQLIAVDAERAEAVPSAMTGLGRRGVTVVLGSHASAISAAAADTATKEHMSFWETGAIGETSTAVAGGRNFFRMAPVGANIGQKAIAFVRDQLAPRLPDHQPLRYAVAYVDDPYGRAVGLGAIDEIHRSGQTFVGTFAYDAQAADFGQIAGAIAGARPDVLFVSAYIDDGVALRRALVAQHVPLIASIGTSSSYCHPQFGAELGADAVGLFASDKPDAAHVDPAALDAEGRAALDWVSARYQQRWHEPMSAPALSGFSSAYALLVHVLPAARTTAVAAVAAAAIAIKLPDGSLANGGGLDIAAPPAPDAGENRRAASVIWEWVASNTRAVVWPPTFATHAIVALPLAGSPRPWPSPQ
ncbi:MAG: hypothetical protein NVSMB12_14040 [Acidimicrobiales bacterium]